MQILEFFHLVHGYLFQGYSEFESDGSLGRSPMSEEPWPLISSFSIFSGLNRNISSENSSSHLESASATKMDGTEYWNKGSRPWRPDQYLLTFVPSSVRWMEFRILIPKIESTGVIGSGSFEFGSGLICTRSSFITFLKWSRTPCTEWPYQGSMDKPTAYYPRVFFILKWKRHFKCHVWDSGVIFLFE